MQALHLKVRSCCIFCREASRQAAQLLHVHRQADMHSLVIAFFVVALLVKAQPAQVSTGQAVQLAYQMWRCCATAQHDCSNAAGSNSTAPASLCRFNFACCC
jgi:hypothetical protein